MRRHALLIGFVISVLLVGALGVVGYGFRYSLWQIGIPVISDFDGESYLRECVRDGLQRHYIGARINDAFTPIHDAGIGLFYTPGGLGIVVEAKDGRVSKVSPLPAP